ncbi:hypothetical protein U771_14160 [Pseudomonas gorinensis]|uniref:Uncharacterized protein n=1 Tax=Pseudomonas gorinensis TaxID=3240790 RepID=A0ACA7P5Z4_9PSED|nr:hypothetical protein U771_14160 [Pseudomonas sp. TKP]
MLVFGAKAFELFHQRAVEEDQQRRGARNVGVPRRLGAIEHQADNGGVLASDQLK